MLIEVQSLSKRYCTKDPFVVKDISFTIDCGETLAIFGDSGSGKSTIGQMLAGILLPTSGQVRFQGKPLVIPFRGADRRQIQMLFQHPEVTFNPRMKMVDSMREPYNFFGISYTRRSHCGFLEQFGIYDDHLNRYPAELSGGELQRLALARVMLIEPSFLILDEPTSMLDVISQAQMIRMLQKIQTERQIGYLFISHDRALCERFCTSILILNEGRLQFAESFTHP